MKSDEIYAISHAICKRVYLPCDLTYIRQKLLGNKVIGILKHQHLQGRGREKEGEGGRELRANIHLFSLYHERPVTVA